MSFRGAAEESAFSQPIRKADASREFLLSPIEGLSMTARLIARCDTLAGEGRARESHEDKTDDSFARVGRYRIFCRFGVRPGGPKKIASVAVVHQCGVAADVRGIGQGLFPR